MTVMQSAHIVLVATKAFAQVFMIKTGAKEKAKVKKASCLVKLAQAKILHEIMSCSVLSDSKIRVHAGNNF